MFTPAGFTQSRPPPRWQLRLVAAILAATCLTAPLVAAAAVGDTPSPGAIIVPVSLEPGGAAPATPAAAQTPLRARLDVGTVLVIGGERLRTPALLRLYAAHGFEPIWQSRERQSGLLLRQIERAGEHGLDPHAFHAAALAKPAALSPVDRDLMMSDAVIRYAEALAGGVVTTANRMDDEDLTADPVDVVAIVHNAIAAPDPVAAIETLAPHSPEYAAMRRAYARYQAAAAAGGWPRLADGQRSALLQRRLAAEGYLPATHAGSPLDEMTTQAIRDFQRHHDIAPDGRIGAGTLAELNIGAEERLHQIAVNLERLRWLPHTLPADRVWVNAANAQLQLFRGDRPVFTTRVVVGETDKQTPEFHATIESVLFNPPWNVPYSIAQKEILPKVSGDPGYLAKHHMTIRKGGGIQQLPGPGSALGQLKFEMPNRFDVYLHDTPLKALFSRDNRRQSHGCVRVQNPRELAALLLQDSPDGINKAIAATTTHRRSLAAPLPVFIVYQTAFAEADGGIQFRHDFYQRDDEIWRALNPVQTAPVAEQNPAVPRRS